MIKGFTVHLETAAGKTACGTTPRHFMGQRGINKNLRYVTCSKCEAIAKAAKETK